VNEYERRQEERRAREGRHRRLIERARRDSVRSLELHAEAKDLQRRADAVGSGGISSEDPGAPDKLRVKLEGLELRRDMMKGVNAAWRRAGQPKPEDAAGVQRFSDLAKLPLARAQTIAAGIHRPGYWGGRAPFLPFELTNLGARIRYTRARIEALEKERAALAQAPATVQARAGRGWEIVQDNEDYRMRLTFDERQPADVVARVRAAGFLWSPTRKAWVRKLSANCHLAADMLANWLEQRTEGAGHED